MDVLEQDYHNFSTPSSHRLPTISGTQAIRKARESLRPISTSLPILDTTLGKASTFNSSTTGGLQRGVVTEVFGPPGVGKTTLALQIAVNAICAASQATSVTWIDTTSQLIPSRLQQLLKAYRIPHGCGPPSSPPLPQASYDTVLPEKFNYLQVHSLTKLLALFLSTANTNFPPPNTSVIVLDDLSNLILSSLPRSGRPSSTRAPHKSPSSIQDAAAAKRILTRRFQVLSSFAICLQKFAATNNVAILVTSKAAVNLKAGQKAVLRPALTSEQWDNHLSVRIALFRDFWPTDASTTQGHEDKKAADPTEFEKRSLRFAKVIRLGGKLVSIREVGFVIESGGLREVLSDHTRDDTTALPLATQPLRPLEDAFDSGINDHGNVSDYTDKAERSHDNDNEEQHASDIHLVERSGQTKRKAIEIADSDDENDEEPDSDAEPRPPSTASQDDGFQPSSQLYQASLGHITKDVSDEAKKSRIEFRHRDGGTLPDHADGKTSNEVTEDDEMLLERYEKEALPFSQAAIDMSDPLTPSDDDRYES